MAQGKGEDLTKEQEEHLSDVVAAAKAVLDVVDLDKVAIWAAKKCKEDDEKESPEGKVRRHVTSKATGEGGMKRDLVGIIGPGKHRVWNAWGWE